MHHCKTLSISITIFIIDIDKSDFMYLHGDMVGQRAGERSVFVGDLHGDVDVFLRPVEDAGALLYQLVVQALL